MRVNPIKIIIIKCFFIIYFIIAHIFSIVTIFTAFSQRFKVHLIGIFMVAIILAPLYIFLIRIYYFFLPHGISSSLSFLVIVITISIVIFMNLIIRFVFEIKNVLIFPSLKTTIHLTETILGAKEAQAYFEKVAKLPDEILIIETHFCNMSKKYSKQKELLISIKTTLNKLDNSTFRYPLLLWGVTPFDFAYQFHKVNPKNLICYGEIVKIPWERARIYGEERPWTLYFVYVPSINTEAR